MMPSSLRPWSYSRLSKWEDCPKQFWYRYIEHLPSARPPSTAADRGKDIHAEAEKYLLGERLMYPPELQKVASHSMLLRQKKVMTEKKLAVREDWSPCEWGDSETYYRAIIDVLYVDLDICHIQDWKTGKVYDSHENQLLDYVPIVAAHYPATTYQTRLIYIDQGFVTPTKSHNADRIKPIRMMLDGRIKNAESDTIFPPNPKESKCKWCDYSKRHGGPCQY